MIDLEMMVAAYEEAKKAGEAGEVPVGAVICSEGKILARGQNRVLRDNDPTAHAEIVAIRAAAGIMNNYRLTGCELAVTMEPCAMCAGAIVHARIGHLVYGTSDPKAGAVGSVLNVINHPQLNHSLEVTNGVMAYEAGELLREFFRVRR